MREHDISIAGGRRYAEVFEDLKNEGSAGPLKGDTLFGDPQGGACAGLIPRANTGAPLRSIYRAHKDNPERCNGDRWESGKVSDVRIGVRIESAPLRQSAPRLVAQARGWSGDNFG